MKKNSETIYGDDTDYRYLSNNSDKIKTSYSFFSYSSIVAKKTNSFGKDKSSPIVHDRIIPNDVVKFVNWKGYVSCKTEKYFDVVVRSLAKDSIVRKFRINNSYIKEGTDVQIDQIVRIKEKYYRLGSLLRKKKDIEVIFDRPLNRSEDVIDDIVAKKMERFAYMFEDDEKR